MSDYLWPAAVYLLLTFPIAAIWHLVLFKAHYATLAIYRPDIIMPFGLLSMMVQAVAFAFVYERIFWRPAATVLSRGLSYAAFGGLLSWSFTTLAVAAKNVMTSVPDYLVIETAFTAVQWIIVGPLTALVCAAATARKEPARA